ncbi:hypothetical protein ACSO1_01760 [Acinetobacter calcoaceticus]|nr:hypothetical protein ACSO1_01760 [Acinetobacter calcoaceticus]
MPTSLASSALLKRPFSCKARIILSSSTVKFSACSSIKQYPKFSVTYEMNNSIIQYFENIISILSKK